MAKESDASQRQESLSQADYGIMSLGAGANAVTIKNTRGGQYNVSVETQGIQGDQLGAILGDLAEGANELGLQLVQVQKQQSQALNEIAQTSTGTRSEAGLLVQQLAVPSLIGLVALAGISNYGKKRRKK